MSGNGESAGFFRNTVMEKDVLNKIMWDSRLNPGDYTVRYFDRVENRLLEVKYADIELDGDFMRLKEHSGGRFPGGIPLHRIREIRCREEVVWSRRCRPNPGEK